MKKLLAMVLAAAMTLSLCVFPVGAATDAFNNGGDFTISVSEDKTTYAVGDTITFTVTVTANKDIDLNGGKTLKIHLYNTTTTLSGIFSSVTLGKSPTYSLKSYTSAGKVGPLLNKSDREISFGAAGSLLIGKDAKITLNFTTDPEKPLTASDMKLSKRNFIAVFAGATDRAHATGAYVLDGTVGTMETGTLTVTNKVEGSGADSSKRFTYKIELKDTSVSGQFDDDKKVNFAGGVATFTLKHNESKTFKNLPVCGFTITESDYGGYTVNNDHGTDAVATGDIISGKTTTVTFTNTKTSSSGGTGSGLTYHLNLPDVTETVGKHTFTDTEPIGENEFTVRELFTDAGGCLFDLSGTSEAGQANSIMQGQYKNGGTTYYFLGWSETKNTSTDGTNLTDIDYIITEFNYKVDGNSTGRSFTDPNPTTTAKDLYAVWSTKPGFAGYSMSIPHADFNFTGDKTLEGGIKLGDNGFAATGAYKYVVLDQARKNTTSATDKGDEYNLTTAVPKADGYTFLGWFNKNANNGNDPNAAYVLGGGADIKFGTTSNVYSVDAVWGSVSGADDASYLYDRATHSIDLSGLGTAFDGAGGYKDSPEKNSYAKSAYEEFFSEKNVRYTVKINDESVDTTYTLEQLKNAATGEGALTKKNVGTYKYEITAELVIPDATRGQGTKTEYTAEIGTVTATLNIIGGLTISKRVEGPGDKTKGFSFSVVLTGLSGAEYKYTDASGVEQKVSVTGNTATIESLSLKNGQSVMLTLPSGTGYTVTEAPAGDDYTTAYSVDGGAAETDSTATGTIGGTGGNNLVQVEFINTRKSGNLTITKEIGGEGMTASGVYTFTVTAPSGLIPNGTSFNVVNGTPATATFTEDEATVGVMLTKADSGSVTIQGLPTGKYTVAEQGTPAGLYTTTYNPGTASSDGVEVEENKTATITVTNTVNTGSLKVTKRGEVNSAGVGVDFPDETFSIKVSLTFPLGVNASQVKINDTPETVKGGAVTLTLKKDENSTISGIPVGTLYTVEEELDPDTQQGHYEVTYTDSPTGTISPTEATVTVTNKYYKITEGNGALWIRKIVQGTGSGGGSYQFNVKFAKGSANQGDYDAFIRGLGSTTDDTYTVSLKDGENRVIFDIPTGTEYTITEVDPKTGEGGNTPANVVVADQDGKTICSGSLETVKAAGTIDASRNVDGYTFYNQYLANLTITKVVENSVPDGTEFKFTLRFSGLKADQVSQLMEIEDANGPRYSKELLEDFAKDDMVTITLRKGTQLVATIKNVPLGVSNYEISETGGDMGDTVEWKVGGSETAGTTDGLKSGTSTGTQVFSADTQAVTFQNTYSTTGWLTIEKKLSGSSAPAGETYQFEVSGGAGDPVEVSITGAGSETVSLPAGDYVVTETTESSDFTTKYAVGGEAGEDPAKVTITVGSTSTVTVTNTYKAPAPPAPPVMDPDRYTPPEELNAGDHVAYIIGYPDGEVKPDGSITRAEVATILFRLLKDDVRNRYWSTENGFSDVARNDWFNNAISTIAQLNLVDGYPDGTFRPDGKMSRAELAAVIARFFDPAVAEKGMDFTDVEKGTWYYEYVRVVSALGIMTGDPDAEFHPTDLVKRSEAMATFNRLLDHRPTVEGLIEEGAYLNKWPDNANKSAWFYADVQEATNSHTCTTFLEDGVTRERWTQVLPVPDWAAYEKAWAAVNRAG